MKKSTAITKKLLNAMWHTIRSEYYLETKNTTETNKLMRKNYIKNKEIIEISKAQLNQINKDWEIIKEQIKGMTNHDKIAINIVKEEYAKQLLSKTEYDFEKYTNKAIEESLKYFQLKEDDKVETNKFGDRRKELNKVLDKNAKSNELFKLYNELVESQQIPDWESGRLVDYIYTLSESDISIEDAKTLLMDEVKKIQLKEQSRYSDIDLVKEMKEVEEYAAIANKGIRQAIAEEEGYDLWSF